MLAFLLGLFVAYDRRHALAKVAAGVGAHYVFELVLGVPFPYASVPALRSLGS